jgi:formylglycine-generating enzyme required for sulfatase activity
VTGGTYYRTYTNDGGAPITEANPATVSSFRLDKYLVTVGRFRQFVTAWNSGACFAPEAGSGKHAHLNGGLGLANGATPGTYEPGWVASDNANLAPTNANLSCPGPATWTPSERGQDNLPITCVNWYEAYAFCIWDGGFLPSDAEWEYAAAGGAEQREYPWGSTNPGTKNQYAIYNCYYPTGSMSCSYTGVTNIAPVGTTTLGAGRWGQLDLAGNIWEWDLDSYAGYQEPWTDCAYLTGTSHRVFRGGEAGTGKGPFLLIPTDERSSNPPTDRYAGIGFRCARTP